ncbi:20382_t:CDS:2 [Dentiscutata erythropus]|uniref:20382_t:CDS:1 n=1 Tax=Dentiscutata erythropus TaxID=1348616 RepID=A0A9N9AXZ0_9GLOM|nr:20382_t:CDS:2 [Dentiscutata erythropus]
MTNSVRVNSIIGKHNYEINSYIDEVALRFCKLTDEILKKIKFWMIHITTQYNLLVASFLYKNLIVATAIFKNKTEAIFVWVLQELINSCDIALIVLYFDADSAMLSAVQKNYLEIYYFHCIFHIDLNLRKKIQEN